jgi:hypothetical protein
MARAGNYKIKDKNMSSNIKHCVSCGEPYCTKCANTQHPDSFCCVACEVEAIASIKPATPKPIKDK